MLWVSCTLSWQQVSSRLMPSGPVTLQESFNFPEMANRWETMEVLRDFILEGSKITASSYWGLCANNSRGISPLNSSPAECMALCQSKASVGRTFLFIFTFSLFLSWKPEFLVTVSQIIIFMMKSFSSIKVAEHGGEVEWKNKNKYLPSMQNTGTFILLLFP